MILIDPRAGSAEIYDYIAAIPGHPEAAVETLTYGDVAFTGNGPQGIWFTGIEVKTLGDVLNCIESQRFTGHQLPGLKATYDQIYLMVQGEYRAHWETGTLQIKVDKGKGEFWIDAKTGQRVWSHYELVAWLTMVELGWGIRTKHTRDYKDTARTLVEMYKVLQKPWEEHKTVNPFYVPEPQTTPFVKPTLVERVMAQVDGIGPAKAREIGKRFPTVARAMGLQLSGTLAYVSEWKGIPGVGKATARKILEQLWYGETNQTKEA